LLVRHAYFTAVRTAIKLFSSVTGLSSIGYRNTLELKKKKLTLHFPGLPSGLDGFTILFFSDGHFDSNPALVPIFADLVKKVDYDICLCGGDYKAADNPNSKELKRLFETAFSSLKQDKPAFAVMGNHDTYKTGSLLKDYFTFLENESIRINYNGADLFIAGVDDCHFYKTDDIKKAFTGIDKDVFTICLSHSPELYRKAALHGADLFLAGHTHGGQVCLPGGIPITGNTRSSKKIIRGLWRQGRMRGYTTTGVGTSLASVRFFCPPEICVITLKKGYGEDRCH
jgi:predicted MPP superfamily phosphohydrolase